MTNQEFAGIDQLEIDFATGTVRGTRSFAVDHLGRLTGLVYKQVWQPGENLATCRAAEDAQLQRNYWNRINRQLLYGFSSYGDDEEDFSIDPGYVINLFEGTKSPLISKAVADKKKADEERKRRDTMDACDHGFYAYYEGSNDFYKKGQINGVIEGYGETLIGSRGFRCMKARIVALEIPDMINPVKAKVVRRNYGLNNDIAFFDSFATMVAAFPPDGGQSVPAPDNDPDFWTRSV